MGFSEAISSGFAKYATFTGRATRPEYWYWVLFNIVVGVIFWLIQVAISAFIGEILHILFDLAVLLPSLAVGARRLHDTDRSGWWLLIGLIPIVGWIILIVWFCQRGTPGANRFG